MKRQRTTEESQYSKAGKPIRIDAGGVIYTTTLSTLTRSFPDSLIARMFAHPEMIPLSQETHAFFIDTDPKVFGAILNVLRRPGIVDEKPDGMSRKAWIRELDYWCIKPVITEKVIIPGFAINSNSSYAIKIIGKRINMFSNSLARLA